MTPSKHPPATHPTVAAAAQAVRDMAAYLTSYVSFTDAQYPLALALWTYATYLWPHFDAFPYLVIRSDTKRAGKTRLSELLAFAASNARSISGVTPATIFHMIRDDSPTLIIDEAESLSSDAADMLRSLINTGYRRGQTFPRMGKEGEVVQWPTYCPKAFVLIGDVTDTYRDRSIIINMQRNPAPSRFVYDVAQLTGNGIGTAMQETAAELRDRIVTTYTQHTGLEFLQDRDEEIWTPLFAVAAIVCPDRLDELTRAAVDMATEKTAPARKFSSDYMRDAEERAMREEYKERLLADMVACFAHAKRAVLSTADLVTMLHALPTGPWRKFRGVGLRDTDVAALLRPAVEPKVTRLGQGRHAKQLRGYRRAEVEAALAGRRG